MGEALVLFTGIVVAWLVLLVLFGAVVANAFIQIAMILCFAIPILAILVYFILMVVGAIRDV